MLNDLKLLLGIAPGDTGLDDKLMLLVTLATARLKRLLGGTEPPPELDYILTEVVVKKFNRIGSEGLSSHSVEGESMNFTENDFAEYDADIQSFLESQENGTRGKLRFL